MAVRSPIQSLGLVRLAVGVGLLAAPRRLTNVADPTGILLMRTIGVRDLVLGLGSILSEPKGRQTWGQMTLLSDSVDVAVGTAAIRSVGLSGGLVAALLPVPFAAAGVRALKRERQQSAFGP